MPAEAVGQRTFVEVLVGLGHDTTSTTRSMEGHVKLEVAVSHV